MVSPVQMTPVRPATHEQAFENPLIRELPDSTGAILVFHGFFITQVISSARFLLMQWLGPSMNHVGAAAQTGAVILGLAAVFLLGRAGACLLPLARLWVWMAFSLVVVLSLYGGLIKTHYLREVMRDASAFILAIGFVALGSSPAFWRQALRWCWFYFILALVINFISMRDYRDLVLGAGLEARVARDSLSYRVQSSLDFWPLLLVMAPYAKEWHRTILAAGMVFMLAQQVLFQKRLETVFLLGLYLLVWWTQKWPLPGKPPPVPSGLFRRIILFSAVGIVFISFWIPSILQNQAGALWRRFAGQAPGQQVEYSLGFWSVFTRENERVQIPLRCFQGFSLGEWLAGRGMGGAFPFDDFDARLLQTSHRAEVINRWYLEDLGYFGRRGFEIGLLIPLLKGGLCLVGIFYTIYFMPLANRLASRRCRFTWGCLVVAYGGLVYTVMGGNFTTGLTFQMLGFYAPLGWCLTRMTTPG